MHPLPTQVGGMTPPCPHCHHDKTLKKHCRNENKNCQWHKCDNCRSTLDLAARRGWDAKQKKITW